MKNLENFINYIIKNNIKEIGIFESNEKFGIFEGCEDFWEEEEIINKININRNLNLKIEYREFGDIIIIN